MIKGSLLVIICLSFFFPSTTTAQNSLAKNDHLGFEDIEVAAIDETNFNQPSTERKPDEDACLGVSCSNRGLCIVNNIYSRGYWCECDEGWAGQDCLHAEPTVECGDRRIDVVIDKGLVQELGIEDDVNFVFFGRSTAGANCRAQEEDNLYKLSIQAPFSNCGTKVVQEQAGDDYTFSNTVVWNREVNNTKNLIDRELVLLDFKCIYEDTYTVSGPSISPTINVIKFANEKGQFEVSMQLYRDDQFDKQYSSSPTVIVGAYVYVQVELAHIQGAYLAVSLDKCFASQSSDPSDPVSTKHVLIDNRCVNENDTTIRIISNGENEKSRFMFQMFRWRYSADDVYIHCDVDICNLNTEVCTGEADGCKGDISNRVRRSVEYTREGVYEPVGNQHFSHVVSQGPIRVSVDHSDKNISDEDEELIIEDRLVIVGLVCTFIVVVILGIVGGAFGRKRLKMKKKLKDKQEQEIRRKHLTSLSFNKINL